MAVLLVQPVSGRYRNPRGPWSTSGAASARDIDRGRRGRPAGEASLRRHCPLRLRV
jgi:hypothetical protein